MELSRSLRSSQQLVSNISRSQQIPRQLLRRQFLLKPTPRRHASASTTPPSKPIILEQPDKFRPPSHPAKLVRPRGSTGGGAYNQQSNSYEREAQKTKTYPHTFPNEGTWKHWLLTNRVLHGSITVVSASSLSSNVSNLRSFQVFQHNTDFHTTRASSRS